MKTLLAAITLLFLCAPAYAETVTVQGTLTLKPLPPPPPLTVTLIGGQIDCAASVGSIVGAAYTSGGKGGPVTFAITAGDMTDFTMQGSLIVVKQAINPAVCGTTQSVTVTATQ